MMPKEEGRGGNAAVIDFTKRPVSVTYGCPRCGTKNLGDPNAPEPVYALAVQAPNNRAKGAK
jgi:hypothetical protein